MHKLRELRFVLEAAPARGPAALLPSKMTGARCVCAGRLSEIVAQATDNLHFRRKSVAKNIWPGIIVCSSKGKTL